MSRVFLFEARLDGDITRLLLRRKKIQQRKAAKILGVSAAQLVQYLAGRYPIPYFRLKRLLKILQIEDPTLILCQEAEHGRR